MQKYNFYAKYHHSLPMFILNKVKIWPKLACFKKKNYLCDAYFVSAKLNLLHKYQPNYEKNAFFVTSSGCCP